MKFLLISAALVAVAFASPVFVKPDITGPSPIINDDSYESINVGPVIIDHESISVGPAIVEGDEEISAGPAIVEEGEQGIAVGPEFVDEPVNSPASPIVQIILNINSQTHVIDVPITPEEVVAPTPVIVVDEAEEYDVDPAPVQIGNPELPVVPSPVVIMPDQLN